MKHGAFLVPVCAACGIVIAGCSAAERTGHSDPGADACGCPIAAPDGGTVIAPRVILVNGALGVGDVRICFDANDDAAVPTDLVVPQTNYPGLVAGGAAELRVAPGGTFNPFALDAAGLGALEWGRAPYTCDSLAKNPSVVKLKIAPFTATLSGPKILALVGCAPNAGAASSCGADYDPAKGNLRFQEVSVASTLAASNGEFGAQFVNLSPSFDAKLGGKAVGLHLGRLLDCQTPDLSFGMLPFGTPVPVSPLIMSQPTLFDTEGFTACDAQKMALFSESYADAQRLTDPRSVPSAHYGHVANYVFTMVGDSTKMTGPEALHVLALRFDATN